MISAFGVEHEPVSKAMFGAKKQVAAQMELLDSVGNKYLKKTPNFNPQGVLHGSPRLSGPKKAGDSVKQVQLNIAGAQARRKVNGQ